MFAQIKLYAYLAVFASISGLCGYGYYLYNKVDSLEQEKQTMQGVIDQKTIEMQKTIEELASARESLTIVTMESEKIAILAEKRRLDVNWLNKKLKNLGGKIAASATPEEFEGEVSSEFVNVVNCIEAASGSKTSACMNQAAVEDKTNES